MKDRRLPVAERKGKKKNSSMKKEAEVVILLTSSSGSEEPNEEEEEEAKSSNNSNQNSNQAAKEEVEEEGEEEDDDEEEDIKGKKDGSSGVVGLGCFSVNRIKRIIRSEGGFRTTHEAIFLINKAAEQFLELFSEDAYGCFAEDHKKALGYKHLSSVVCKRKRYDFLSDFVPEKIRAEDALEERKLTAT